MGKSDKDDRKRAKKMRKKARRESGAAARGDVDGKGLPVSAALLAVRAPAGARIGPPVPRGTLAQEAAHLRCGARPRSWTLRRRRSGGSGACVPRGPWHAS